MAAKKEAVTKTNKTPNKVLKSGSASKEKKTAVKKPAAKKTAAVGAKSATPGRVPGKTTDKTTEIRKVAAKAKVAGDGQKQAKPTPEERYRMVETAAYFIAERSGFQGDSAAHWAAAELEIAALLKDQEPQVKQS